MGRRGECGSVWPHGASKITPSSCHVSLPSFRSLLLAEKIELFNGDRFKGGWALGRRHGRGVYTFASGARYEASPPTHKSKPTSACFPRPCRCIIQRTTPPPLCLRRSPASRANGRTATWSGGACSSLRTGPGGILGTSLPLRDAIFCSRTLVRHWAQVPLRSCPWSKSPLAQHGGILKPPPLL